MPLKYNPLLSIGLEDAGNGGSSEEIAALKTRLDNLETNVRELQTNVSSLLTDVASLKSRVLTLETNVNTLLTDVASVKSRVSTLETNVNTLLTDVASLKSRVSTLETNYSSLQSQLITLSNLIAHKITKCLIVSDLDNLANDEIFQWQGADTDNFKNGYFYKSLITTQTVPAGTQYFEYPTGFPTIVLNGYTFAPGKYYLVQDNTPGVSSNFSNFYVIQYRPNTDLYTVSESSTPTVGQKFYNKNTLSYITVTDINGQTLTFSDGTSFSYEYTSSSRFDHLFRIIAENGNIFDMITSGMGALICHYTLSGDVFSLTDWFRIQEPLMYTLADAITIRVASYTQTNTQPNFALFSPNVTVNRNNINSGVTFAELAQYLNSLFLSYAHAAYKYTLFADATSQYVDAPTSNRVGFAGLVITERVLGNTTTDTSCNLIAVVYSTSQSRFSCSANNNTLLPVLVSYNDKIYCALKFTARLSKYIHFVGIRQGAWLESPISVDEVTSEIITGSIFSN